MQFLVRCPFHSALRLRELVDQIEKPIVFHQIGLLPERLLQFRIDIVRDRVRFGFKHEQVAQIRNQVRHQTHHVFAGFALLVEDVERGGCLPTKNFSGQIDQATGELVPVKQPYTRIQTGLTLGGPIKRDKTFFFGSYEYTQREETGFSSIGIDNFGMAPFACGPGCPLNGLLLTPDQSAATLQLLSQGPAGQAVAAQYAFLMGSASSVALNKLDPGPKEDE